MTIIFIDMKRLHNSIIECDIHELIVFKSFEVSHVCNKNVLI